MHDSLLPLCVNNEYFFDNPLDAWRHALAGYVYLIA